jgi:hypothetical protein
MSVTIVCDYCGEPIDDALAATVKVDGEFPAEKRLSGHGYFHWTHGHYHTDRDVGCWWTMAEAMKLVQESGPSLETIPTISNQAVAARRRKHTKPATEARMDPEHLADLHDDVQEAFHSQWIGRAESLETIAAMLDRGDADGARKFAREAAAQCRKAADHIASKRLARGEA